MLQSQGDRRHAQRRAGAAGTVPAENCVVVPGALDVEIVAFAEPMTVCAEAVDTGGVPGDRVLVLGPGNIGQGVALFARAAGAAEVVIVGKDDAPRLECLRRMGFPETVDVGDRTLEEALAPYLAKGKFDVVIEATGVPAIVQQGLNVLRKRGVLVVGGIHPKPVSVNLTRLVREHQQIRGSYRAPVATWTRVLRFLTENAELARQMITHRLPWIRRSRAGALAHQRASKVMIVPRMSACNRLCVSRAVERFRSGARRRIQLLAHLRARTRASRNQGHPLRAPLHRA